MNFVRCCLLVVMCAFLLTCISKTVKAEPQDAVGAIFGLILKSSQKEAKKIARIQSLLLKAGYYRGEIDGEFGPQTESAIKAFQADQGLPVTGKLTKRELSQLTTTASEDSEEGQPPEKAAGSIPESVQTHPLDLIGDDERLDKNEAPLDKGCQEIRKQADQANRTVLAQLMEDGANTTMFEEYGILGPGKIGDCFVPIINEANVSALRDELASRKRRAQQDEEARKRVRDETEKRAGAISERQGALERDRALSDPQDVVAQVLNFTTTGVDQGTEFTFWIKTPDEGGCVYRKSGSAKSLDLNQLDRKNITFVDQEMWDGARYAGVATLILHEGRDLFEDPFMRLLGNGQRDHERLARGWDLIYSAHCKGRVKPF